MNLKHLIAILGVAVLFYFQGYSEGSKPIIYTPAPPTPLNANLFDSGPKTNMVIIDMNGNIFVYGKWVANKEGLLKELQ